MQELSEWFMGEENKAENMFNDFMSDKWHYFKVEIEEEDQFGNKIKTKVPFENSEANENNIQSNESEEEPFRGFIVVRSLIKTITSYPG